MTAEPATLAAARPAAELDSHTMRIVHALALTGSITAAAAALGYSQPAVSQHLKRLEARIGMPVVTRSGRRVRFTEAGEVLVRHAAAVTSALQAAEADVADLAGLRSGRMRLAAFPSASATLVPRLIGALGREHPGVSVSYLEAEPPEAIAAVREQRADLAITFDYPGDAAAGIASRTSDAPDAPDAPGADAALTGRGLWRDEMRVVLPAGHAQAGAASIRLDALAGERWIAGCPRCRGHLVALADRAGFAPTIGYETDNSVAVLGMVAAGLGVALLPSLALASAAVPPGVAVLPTADRDARSIRLVVAAARRRMPAISAAIAALGALEVDGLDLGAIRTPAARSID